MDAVKEPLRYLIHLLTKNWRKAGGSQRMIEISKRENFYQENIVDAYFLFVILTNEELEREREN